MTNDNIKIMIAREIIDVMNDQSAADVLRCILFMRENKINWQKAYEDAMVYMPELKKDYS